MGEEIREYGGQTFVTSAMNSEHEPGKLHVYLGSRWTLERVDGWSLRDGLRGEVLAADHGSGSEYHYVIDQSCDLTCYISIGESRVFENFHHWDGARAEKVDEELFLARWRQKHPVTFGDVRSVVAQAMETTEHEAMMARWRLCRRGLIWMDQETPEFEAALGYVMDYLDRFLEREPMAKLEGTKSQQQWAKKLRLRAIQRLGLLHDDHTDPRARIDCKFARLSARTISESSHWISVSDRIQKASSHDTMAWLLSGW